MKIFALSSDSDVLKFDDANELNMRVVMLDVIMLSVAVFIVVSAPIYYIKSHLIDPSFRYVYTLTHTFKHAHTLYIYMCVCVCV